MDFTCTASTSRNQSPSAKIQRWVLLVLLSYKILNQLKTCIWLMICSFFFPTQCLFPLVSQPLDDVLASLVPGESSVAGKRRLSVALDQEVLIKPAHKRLRSDEPEAPLVQEEPSATNDNSINLNEKDSELVNGCPRDSLVTTELDSLQKEHSSLVETAVCVDVSASAPCATIAELQQSSLPTLVTTDVKLMCSPHDFTGNCVLDPSQGQSRCISRNPDQAFNANSKATAASLQLTTNTGGAPQKSTGVSIPLSVEAQGLGSLAHVSSSITATQSVAFVPFRDKLFWSNSNNLCWLDSMLVALVNCEGLKKRKPHEKPQESSVWQLIRQYEAISAAVQVHQQPGRG